MTRPPLRTALFGMGKVGAGYAMDPIMARHFPYASHAQVLRHHPAFHWLAVVEIAEDTLRWAREQWQIPCAVKSAEELSDLDIEVAVIATPPSERLSIVRHLPKLRAVLVEKPLGGSLAEAEAFMAECRRRNILVQVNYWRRADETFRGLANGRLAQLLGKPQAVLGIYGNGLLNNGSHMVDFIRMLCGEMLHASATGPAEPTGPIPGDLLVPLHMTLSRGAFASLLPIRFSNYRENSLDIWGEKGRLSIFQEGLGISFHPIRSHRAQQDAMEVACDISEPLTATAGHAFYHLYSNLASAIWEKNELWSSGESALQTERIVARVYDSAGLEERSTLIPPAPSVDVIDV
ncbi:Oxidoreductase family, NAD-binding Rossmann fold [compost metagenome]